MKRRIIMLLTLILTGLSVKAIPLFPFFVDVAGNYSDGVHKDLVPLKISAMYSSKPSFYSTLAEAEEFLKDCLPFSTEKIDRSESINKETKVKIVKYTSPMLDNKVSTLYLIEIPNKGFFVAYNE